MKYQMSGVIAALLTIMKMPRSEFAPQPRAQKELSIAQLWLSS
jgi:hypothetical protein